MERLGQQDLWVADGVADRVVLLLPREGQLRECRLVSWSVFNIDEVLVIWDAVIFGQLKQTDESLEQRGPEERQCDSMSGPEFNSH